MGWRAEVERISELVDPEYLTKMQAYAIGHLWLHLKPKRILEIGTFKGTGACYLGAMAKDYGGHVTTVDLPWTAELNDKITILAETQIEKCGVDNVTIVRRPDGAEGWIRDFMNEGQGKLDFVYLDGGHDLKTVTSHVIMAMAVLKVGGWMVMDDIASPSWQDVGFAWKRLVPLITPLEKYRYVTNKQGFVMKINEKKLMQELCGETSI